MAVRDIKQRSRFVQKYTLISFSHFRSLSIRKSACVNVFFGSVKKARWLDSHSKSHMFTLFTGRHIDLEEVLQHGCSVLNSIILHGVFRRISQLWDSAHTLNFENWLLCLSSINITISWLYLLHGFWFYFHCVTMLALYTWCIALLLVTSLCFAVLHCWVFCISFCVLVLVSVRQRLQTVGCGLHADCGLRTGTANCGLHATDCWLGLKSRLRVKCRLKTWVQGRQHVLTESCYYI